MIHFQSQWKNNLLVDLVEPHITIKAQGGLTDDIGWIEKLQRVCKDFSLFEVSVAEPMFFGESVFFLSIKSDKIVEIHRNIVNEISPENELIKKYMELDDYVPHLTLGQTFWGLSSEELKDMAKNIGQEPSPYPTFEVNYIRIYQEVETNRYVKYLDIPLG
ncbi:2'-5' RNA ligase family protein [Chengkuizengella sediminis]|uniref:2'-5' RNA ligase family protein n=1 Tax=Chengkuizengella sediminis TaxID=1885917 RepID=UPI0030B80E10